MVWSWYQTKRKTKKMSDENAARFDGYVHLDRWWLNIISPTKVISWILLFERCVCLLLCALFSSFGALAVNKVCHWRGLDTDGNAVIRIVWDRFCHRIHRWAERWCCFWCGHSWMWLVLWMFLWAECPSVPNANETYRSQSMALSVGVQWYSPSLHRPVIQCDRQPT